MNTAGWLDVWHLVIAIIARQQPFAQIMLVTGAVFLAVMALEGIRTSVLAMWRAHRHVPSATLEPRPQAFAATGSVAPSKVFSVKSQSRFTAAAARRPKPLTISPRQFRSPRPKIRRHPKLEFASFTELPENSAHAAYELRDAL